jgi:hypothetical protein
MTIHSFPPTLSNRLIDFFDNAIEDIYQGLAKLTKKRANGFLKSPWQKEFEFFNAATDDAEKRRHLAEMVRLANNHWRARRTMYRVHEMRRPGNRDDDALTATIFDKVIAFSRGDIERELYAWGRCPDDERRRWLAQRLLSLARTRNNFSLWVEVFERLGPTDKELVRESALGMITLMRGGKQVKIVLNRLEVHPDLRLIFWQNVASALRYCSEAIVLHLDWLTDGECRDLQNLVARLPRDMSQCPVNYRGICQNTDCPIAGGRRRERAGCACG